MDTVIPNADISKTQNITFFQLYQKYPFLHPKIFQDIFGCGTEPSSTK